MNRRKGQTTAEYVLLGGLVVGGVVAMTLFCQRTLQGKLKGVSDNLTAETGGGLLQGPQLSQYEPYYQTSNYNVTQSRHAEETYTPGGKVDRTGINDQTTRTGSSTTGTDVDAGKDVWK